MENVEFLSTAFKQADIVYLLHDNNDSRDFLDPTFDLVAYYSRIGNNYKQAISHGDKRTAPQTTWTLKKLNCGTRLKNNTADPSHF